MGWRLWLNGSGDGAWARAEAACNVCTGIRRHSVAVKFDICQQCGGGDGLDGDVHGMEHRQRCRRSGMTSSGVSLRAADVMNVQLEL